MIGRMFGCPFDHGRMFTLFNQHLWPPLLSLFVLILSPLLLSFPFEVFGSYSVFKLIKCLFSWWKHWELAALISDWHRKEFKLKMKTKGIKPRWATQTHPL